MWTNIQDEDNLYHRKAINNEKVKHLNEGLITLNSAFVRSAFFAYPSVHFFRNAESNTNQIHLLNSQFYLRTCTNHSPRLTSASTEMWEEYIFGNDLSPLRTGVLTFCSLYLEALVLHLSLQFCFIAT